MHTLAALAAAQQPGVPPYAPFIMVFFGFIMAVVGGTVGRDRTERVGSVIVGGIIIFLGVYAMTHSS
jgi:putative Mn2+ efflux pump MntP